MVNFILEALKLQFVSEYLMDRVLLRDFEGKINYILVLFLYVEVKRNFKGNSLCSS